MKFCRWIISNQCLWRKDECKLSPNMNKPTWFILILVLWTPFIVKGYICIMSIIYFACALNKEEVSVLPWSHMSQAVEITSLWHTLFYLHVKWIRCRRVNTRWMKKLSDFSNRICLYHSLCSHHSYLNADTGTIWFESVFNMPSCPPT